jgi:hypothetical protein
MLCTATLQVFSHMADVFLLEKSVQHMSVAHITEALHITQRLGMADLGLRYSNALVNRLTTELFVQVRNRQSLKGAVCCFD